MSIKRIELLLKLVADRNEHIAYARIHPDQCADLLTELTTLRETVKKMADLLDDKREWHYYYCRSLMGADEACDCGGDALYEAAHNAQDGGK